MAKYSSKDFAIKFDDSLGAPQDVSQYITDAGPMDTSIATEGTTPFGASDETNASAGVKAAKAITLKGPYDDTATTGPVALFNAKGDTRTLEYDWGGGKSSSVEVLITDFKRVPGVKKLTGFEVTLLPTGPVTEV